MNSKLLIIVQGPTAIGKTLTSIQLANYYNTEIISCDSRQFYKELLIGSAPPNKEQLKEIQHHFIQHLSVKEIYNVGKFEHDAIKKINQLLLIHNKIIMVGGSGLYIDEQLSPPPIRSLFIIPSLSKSGSHLSPIPSLS